MAEEGRIGNANKRELDRLDQRRDDRTGRGAHPRTDGCGMRHVGRVVGGGLLNLVRKRPVGSCAQ